MPVREKASPSRRRAAAVDTSRRENEARREQGFGAASREDSPAGPAGDDTPTIVIEDEGLRAGFTQLPNYVFRIRGLSHGSKLTYALLLSYAWQSGSCFPGQQTLADDLDVSVRSVGDYLRELQERGLIRVQRRGLGRTNIYHILRLSTAPSSPPVAGAPAPGPASGRAKATKGPSSPGVECAASGASSLDQRDPAYPDRQDSAYQDRRHPASPHRKRCSTPDSRQSSTQIDARPMEQTSEKETPEQQALAAAVGLAQAVLARWGIVEARLVAELSVAPAEVLRQATALEEHLAAGRTITNPAGWLVEAVRASYRPVAPRQAGAAATSPSDSLRAPLPDTAHGDGQAGGASGDAWDTIKGELQSTVTAASFQRWFAPTFLVGAEDGALVVGVPGEHERDYLEHRLRGAIERAASVALGHSPAISFVSLQQSL